MITSVAPALPCQVKPFDTTDPGFDPVVPVRNLQPTHSDSPPVITRFPVPAVKSATLELPIIAPVTVKVPDPDAQLIARSNPLIVPPVNVKFLVLPSDRVRIPETAVASPRMTMLVILTSDTCGVPPAVALPRAIAAESVPAIPITVTRFKVLLELPVVSPITAVLL